MLNTVFDVVWHLSPEDSPDIVGLLAGKVVLVEVKTTVKDHFYIRRDADTISQYERLLSLAKRYTVYYAVKFMSRGWRFYYLPAEGFSKTRLTIPDGMTWEDLNTRVSLL